MWQSPTDAGPECSDRPVLIRPATVHLTVLQLDIAGWPRAGRVDGREPRKSDGEAGQGGYEGAAGGTSGMGVLRS